MSKTVRVEFLIEVALGLVASAVCIYLGRAA